MCTMTSHTSGTWAAKSLSTQFSTCHVLRKFIQFVYLSYKTCMNVKCKPYKKTTMLRVCCVTGCNNIWNPTCDISYFGFPLKNENLLEKWKQVIPITYEITKYTTICSDHFSNASYTYKSGKRFLNKNAVPTIFHKDYCCRRMAKSVSVYEKPTSNIGLSDWYAKQWELEKAAATRISEGFELRNSGRLVRDETHIRTEWDTYMNNSRLADRITELSRWCEIWKSLSDRIASETDLLRAERSNVAKALESLNVRLQTTARCISMRNCRRGSELTYDEPDKELKKELCIIERVKKILTDRVQAAWEKLNGLEEVRFKVNLDLDDKTAAIQIEKENLQLNRNSASISNKPNSLRTLKRCTPYETWLEHCRHTQLLADNELSDSYNFRESMYVIQERASNDIKAQLDVTDFALRKRIYQTEKARNELAWQKLKMRKEMESLRKELSKLEDALMGKTNAVKCVETRLENRTYRPGYELCRDETEFGLKNEVVQLRRTKEDLTIDIHSTKATYNALEALLIRIDRNLDDKEHSLMTDVKCLDMRSSLKSDDPAKLANETDLATSH